MKPKLTLLGLTALTTLLTQTAFGESPAAPPPAVADQSLYTQVGTDPSFANLVEHGNIKPGVSFSKDPVLGSHIQVNKAQLEKQAGPFGAIPQDIGLHTEVCGDSIRRKDFPKWTRWYQEDGNVQIFRLFKGDQNVRGGLGAEGKAGRIEAYTPSLKVAPGTWREWEGTYTIVKPVGGCIFQLMHAGGSLWPMHIDMTSAGEIHFLRRHAGADPERTISIATNMVGQSISLKVRANGEDYEVYQKAPLDSGPWKLVTKGTGPKAQDNKIQFRWGIYCGSKKGSSVANDGLLFVTGVKVK